MSDLLARLGKGLRGLSALRRLPEVAACRRATRQWLRLTAGYIGFPIRLPLEIQLATGPFRFETIADVRTFWPIFFGGIYEARPGDRLIVDAGANIGAFSLYALLAAPQARVIAIEPAPDSCSRLRQVIREHGLEHRFTLHQAALGGRTGVTTLNMQAGSQFRSTGAGGIEVPLLMLDQIVKDAVDLLKLDIEGAEYETLAAASPDTLRHIHRLAMEYHPNQQLSVALAPLEQAGFTTTSVREDGGGYGLAYLVSRPASSPASS